MFRCRLKWHPVNLQWQRMTEVDKRGLKLGLKELSREIEKSLVCFVRFWEPGEISQIWPVLVCYQPSLMNLSQISRASFSLLQLYGNCFYLVLSGAPIAQGPVYLLVLLAAACFHLHLGAKFALALWVVLGADRTMQCLKRFAWKWYR